MTNHSASNINIDNNRAESQADSYKCPKCASNRVRVGYPEIQCLACGLAEPLIDFPITWDFHRHYCREYGLPDPGPCEPSEHTVDELSERLQILETRFDQLSDVDLKRLGFAHIKEELNQLKLGLRYTQHLIPRKPAKVKGPPIKRKTRRGFVIHEHA